MAALGTLSHALRDVVSPAGRLTAARALADHVYGPYVVGKARRAVAAAAAAAAADDATTCAVLLPRHRTGGRGPTWTTRAGGMRAGHRARNGQHAAQRAQCRHPSPCRPSQPCLPNAHPCRYLWTDAFGVVNYLTLACETGEQHYLEQAAGLIDGGRHRGWPRRCTEHVHGQAESRCAWRPWENTPARGEEYGIELPPCLP